MPLAGELENFVQKVFAINPKYFDVFGNNLPGMAGTAITSQGATTSATDVTNQLREDTAKLLKAKQSSQDVTQLVKKIEGHLMMLQTLDTISGRLCNSLIDEL